MESAGRDLRLPDEVYTRWIGSFIGFSSLDGLRERNVGERCMGAEVGLLMRPYLPWILLLATACSETSAVELKESQTSTPPISSTNTPQDPCASILAFDYCCSTYRCGWMSKKEDLGFPGACVWQANECSEDGECGENQTCLRMLTNNPDTGDCKEKNKKDQGKINPGGVCWPRPSPP